MKKSVFFTILFAFFATFANADDTKFKESYNYLRGMEAYQNDNSAEALDYFNKEVSENPKNGYAFLMIGVLRYAEEEYGKSMTALDKAIKTLPKKDKEFRSSAYLTKALIHEKLGNNEAAEENYTMAVKTDPEDESAYQYRAEYYFKNNKYDLADADYRKLITMDKGKDTGYMGLGRNNLRCGNYDEALKQFDNVIQMYPTNSRAYAFRGECYFKKGDYDRAADDAITAYGIDYDEKAFYLLQEIADSALMPVVTRIKIKKMKEPTQSHWPYLLGTVYESTKNYPKAIEEYKESFNLDADAQIAYRISSSYEQLGDYDKAIEYINQSIRLDSTNSYGLAQKGDLLYDYGRAKEAIDTYTQFIQSDPEFAGGYYRRGFMKDNLNDVDGAIEDYSVCITLDPTYYYAYLGRGDKYMLKGMKAEAMKDYRKVIELDTVPSTSSCAFYAYHQLGEDTKAIAFLDSVLQKYPDDAGSYYDAACLYSRMGQYDKSVDYLRQSFQKGFRRFRHIENDDDLDPIKNRDDFKALIKEYKQKSEQQAATVAADEYEETVSEVPFTKTGGVCDVKCEINGLPLHFVFDTGASDVSISNVEANFMLKNGYLKPSDIQGTQYYSDANGDISAGTVINIRKVHFGDIDLENIKASVVRNQKAPLLLGQTVFQKIGKIEIDNTKQVIKLTYRKKK